MAYTHCVSQHALWDKHLQCFALVSQSCEEPCRPNGGQMRLVQTWCTCVAVRSHGAVRMTMGWAPNKRWTATQSPTKTTAPLMTRAEHQSSARECPVLFCQALYGVLHVVCLIDLYMQSPLPQITLWCRICARQFYGQSIACQLCGCTLNTSCCVCCPYVPQAWLHGGTS